MQKVYFISGLGADRRVFSNLELPNVEILHIDWVKPSAEDTMTTYATKLLPQIDTTVPVTILGLSFGGMLAVELSHLIEDSQTILLSTAITASAIPLRYKLLGKWNVPNKVPFSLVRKTNALTHHLFGLKTAAHKVLLKEILSDTDEYFFRWAIEAILNWENEKVPLHVTQIHGTKDHILPLVETSNLIKVEGGGHLMVLEQADLVTEILKEILF
ncbi:MAG: pimeloyl-ACP methyl ester carboxylesterase [Aureispira sp.]|jgi:pimeloyl-ACP methyl ester carboxylesterase